MNRRHDDAPRHRNPQHRTVEGMIVERAGRNDRHAGIETRKPAGVEGVADDALVGASEIVVHPHGDEEERRFAEQAEIRADAEGGGDEEEEQAARLVGGHALRGDGSPWLVERVFEDFAGQALVRDVFDQEGDPEPEEDLR